MRALPVLVPAFVFAVTPAAWAATYPFLLEVPVAVGSCTATGGITLAYDGGPLPSVGIGVAPDRKGCAIKGTLPAAPQAALFAAKFRGAAVPSTLLPVSSPGPVATVAPVPAPAQFPTPKPSAKATASPAPAPATSAASH